MDDVVALWGKPHGLVVMPSLDRRTRAVYRQVTLTYGFGLDFAFHDDVLERVDVQGVDGAHLAGGPKLGDSRAAVRASLGEPRTISKDGRTWTYVIAGTALRLRFIAKVGAPEPLLRVISLALPQAATGANAFDVEPPMR